MLDKTGKAMPAEDVTTAVAVASWAGFELDTVARDRLVEYRKWITQEALAAGGIGPNEENRMWSRHLADSLTYLMAIDSAAEIVDIGSGIGLPGVPLAAALPQTQFTLLDRSERRCLLARRAVRVLGLDNVSVVCGDAKNMKMDVSTAVSRAAQTPEELLDTARRLLPTGAIVVTAATTPSPVTAEASAWEVIEVPPELLGRPSFLLKASLSDRIRS